MFYLLCKWTLRWEKVRDREKNSRKGPRYLFQIEKNSRQRSSREYTNVQRTELFVRNREKFEIERVDCKTKSDDKNVTNK